jgi:serine/threonine protein kinase
MDRYQPIDRIGEGAYGVVFKARDRQTNDFVALKRIRCDEEGIPATAHREIALLKAVRCENVVTLRDAVQHENRVSVRACCARTRRRAAA